MAKRKFDPVHPRVVLAPLRLGKFFGMEAQYWMNLQLHYDLEVAKEAIAGKLDRKGDT